MSSACAQRGRRFSAALVAEANRLHDGGWSAYAIAALFRRRGTHVDERTVKAWVDPDTAARRREQTRQRMRRINAERTGGRLGAGPPRSPDFRFARIVSLRALGLSRAAVAKVMTFDFPDTPVTEAEVRYALEVGRPPAAFGGRS